MAGIHVKRLAALLLVVVFASGCGLKLSDDERLDKVDVEGTECVVVRNGFGRVKYLDCDWGQS